MPARGCQQRFFVQIISAELCVQISKDSIIFDVRRVASGRPAEVAVKENRMPDINLVAVIPGVAEVVARGDGGRIGGRECGKKRVAVYKMTP